MTDPNDNEFHPVPPPGVVPESEPATPKPPSAPERIGFLAGVLNVPDDFDEMGREEIEEMFYGPKDSSTENDGP